MWALARAAFSCSRRYVTGSARALGKADGEFVPWYVAEAKKVTQLTSEQNTDHLPALPADSPESLSRVVEFAVRDMGLKDVTVLDNRSDERAASALGQAIIVLGTGTSTRHLGSAGMLLISWLKKEFQILAGREGILSTNKIKVYNRRQLRKQRRQRMGSENSDSLVRVGPWIAVDTKLDNIYVHLMTAKRREEVKLESLSEDQPDPEEISSESLELSAEYHDPSPQTTTGFGSRATVRPSAQRRQYSTAPDLANREELALSNLLQERRNDLTEDSAEVRSFVDLFPALPSRMDWKRRLRFFAIAAIQSHIFSLKRLLKEAECQQAAGYCLDDEDLDMVLSSICYHGQAHFAELAVSDETIALWQELCDYKAHLIIELYDFAFRPAGRSLVGNPRHLTMLYRTFTCPSVHSTTPATALVDPDPSEDELEAFFDSARLHPIRHLIETTGEMRNSGTVAMVLTSLVNRGSYDAFWRFASSALAAAADADASAWVTELSVALIVKSNDRRQIQYAIQTFVPNSIAVGSAKLSPKLAEAVESGLKLVDESQTAVYEPVRAILTKFHESHKSLPEMS